MMAEWIVVIATACGGSNVILTPSNNLSYRVPSPNPPHITVSRHPTRESAEERALYIGFEMGCSSTALVITPDGKAYTVKSVEKKRKVVREIEEPDGWETRWEEVRQ